MKLILLYLLGNRKAIESFISNKNTLKLSFFLLLTASFAREYDQLYFKEEGATFFLKSLIPSLFLSFFLFFFIYHSLSKKANKTTETEVPRLDFSSQYGIFLGLFWMTSPIAWIYAIPVEEYYSSLEATSFNLSFLAIVSLWRVLLCSRIVSVWLNVHFGAAFFCLLFPASMAALVGSFFSGMSMLDAMGGTRLSPERELLRTAIGTIFNGAGLAVFFSFFGFASVPALQVGKESRAPKQPDQTLPLPYFSMLFLVLACVALAIPVQEKIEKSWTLLQLYEEAYLTVYEANSSEEKLMQQHRKMIQYLSQFEPNDFSKAYRIPPDPYLLYVSIKMLPFLILAMDGSEKPWVRQHYIHCFSIALKQHRDAYSYDKEATREFSESKYFLEMLRKIAQFPGGKEVLTQTFEDYSQLNEKFSLKKILAPQKENVDATEKK